MMKYNMIKRFTFVTLFSGLLAFTPVNSAFAQVIKIMPLGDSITRGVTGSNPVGGYRDDLANLLTNALINFDFVGSQNDGTGFDADHEGHNGLRADSMVTKIDAWIAAANPDIVILHIGTNDISADRSGPDIITDIGTIVDKIVAHNSSTKIYLSTLIPRRDAQDPATTALNASIENLVSQKANVGVQIFLADPNSVFKANPNWQNDYMFDDLHPNNIGYAIMAQVYFDAINANPQQDLVFIDEFDRPDIGPDWTVGPDFIINNGELVNNSTTTAWELAVFNKLTNPKVSTIVYGATADAQGIRQSGIALRLSANSTTANGYLIRYNHQTTSLELFTIKNGLPDQNIASISSAVPLNALDTLKVEMSTDNKGHHFDCSINNQLIGTLTDPFKTFGNEGQLYSGVILRGSNNNNITRFTYQRPADLTSPEAISDLTILSMTGSSASIQWTAPHEDGNQGGQVSSYDIRYSTSPINEANFLFATPATNPPIPAFPGTVQNFSIGGLASNTTYYFAIKSRDDAGNISPISNVPFNTTSSQGSTIDDFERTQLGPNWTVGPEYQITNGELENTATDNLWDHLAVFNLIRNPSEVSFQYGITSDVTGRAGTGLAVMLDANSTTANGYLCYIKSDNSLRLWRVVSGSPLQEIAFTNSAQPFPDAGHTFKVVLSSDASGHHFDYFVNGLLAGRLTDPNKLEGNGNTLYSGVMLRGGRSNNIDNFALSATPGEPSSFEIVSGNNQTGTVGKPLPDPLVVKIRDQNGNPVPGVGVDFTVTLGDGTVQPVLDQSNIFIEAESGTIQAPMTISADPAASGGQYVVTPNGNGQAGSVTLQFTVQTGGSYKIWGRCKTPSGTDDSFFISVDGGTEFLWDVFQGIPSGNQWEWDEVSHRGNGTGTSPEINPVIFQLDPGTHTLLIRTREDGTRLDKILITNNLNFVPTGTGESNIPVTNEFGEAKAMFTLGTTVGTNNNQVQASVPTAPQLGTLLFTASAVADSASTITKISGDNQQAVPGQPTANPMVVELRDKFGNLVPNYPVNFTVTQGNGTLAKPNPVMSDALGRASNTLTLATDVAVNKVQVSAPGVAQPVTFTATALPGDPDKMVVVGGDNQMGQANQALPESLKVQIVDVVGSPISGHNVTFEVKTGGGKLNGSQTMLTVTTGADGIAKVAWTLGPDFGAQNTVEARALFNGTDLQNSPHTFTATTFTPGKISLESGNNQNGTAGKPLPQPFVVKVTTADGLTPVQGVDVNFNVTKGNGNFNGNNSVTVSTNGSGLAQATLTLGPDPGSNNEVEASASFNGTPLTGSPVKFSASSAVPQDLVRISPQNFNGTVNLPLADSIKVKVKDALGNSLPNYPVNFEVTAGGGKVNGKTTPVTVLTDENGIAKVQWTLGPDAGQNNNKLTVSAEFNGTALNGSPIEFVASSEPGAASHIVKVSGDEQTSVIQNPLPEPFVVKVTDGQNPVSGWPVTFTVVAGGGNIEGQQSKTVSTNAEGLASATLTLGNQAGLLNNVVEATSENAGTPLNGSPVVFKATATSSSASTLTLIKGNNQTGQAGLPLPEKIQVKVTDNQGNPITDHPVQFKVIQGGGTINGEVDTAKVIQTDANGIASITWYMGGKIGPNGQKLEIRANDGVNDLSGSPMIVQATAGPGPVDPNVSSVTSDRSQVPADGQSVATITVTLTDKFGNPISGKAVLITATGSMNSITQPLNPTDQNGEAVGTISSTKAEIKTISARSIIDQLNLNSSVDVEFVPLGASKMELSGGNNQTGNIGTALAQPIEVVVKDQFNNPVPGVIVEYVVVQGGGSIVELGASPGKQNTSNNVGIITNAQGIAAATWILGPEPGRNRVEARVSGLIGSPVVFNATGVTSEATSISLVSGDSQSGMVGTQLQEPLKVLVTDSNGNPVWNVPVTFSVESGGGSLSVENATTDFQGVAQTRYTLGPQAGTQTVKATSSGLNGSPITFTFNATVGTPAVMKALEGDGGSGVVNTLYKISVVITDIFGNPVEGVQTNFSVKSGNATIESMENVTSNQGVAAAQIRLPTTIGPVEIRATSSDLPNFFVDFLIHVIPGNATTIAELDGNNQSGTVGRFLVFPLKVLVTDAFGNPVAGREVTWVTQGGNLVDPEVTVTGEDGVASTNFKIVNMGTNQAAAIALGLNGSPVNFVATGVSNHFPVFVGLRDTSIVEGNTLSFTVEATDDDNDPLTYEAQNLPPGATFNPATRTFSWTPGSNDAGEHQVTFIVHDNQGGLDAETITITVKNSNHPPEVLSFTPSEFELVFEKGGIIVFSVSVTDADNDPISYVWKNNNVRVSTSSQYEFITDSFEPGSYTVEVEISDGQDMVQLVWKIDVVVSVQLSSFVASFSEFKGVELSWNTSREVNNLGFNVLRSLTRGGKYEQINDELIPHSSQGSYYFVDPDVEAGKRYFYILEDVNLKGEKNQHGPIAVVVSGPETFELSQNFPNPFNPETKIRFKLPKQAHVVIKIYNILGREVRTLVDEKKEPGFYEVVWDATDNLGRRVSSGVYYYRISAGEFKATKKMLLLK